MPKTIVCFGDPRPSQYGSAGITDLTADFNKIVAMSPTSSCDAIFCLGDFDKVSQTYQAWQASTAKNIPIYFIVGNHEFGTSGDVSFIQGHQPTAYPIHPGPAGTDKTTYSVDIGELHVIVADAYDFESSSWGLIGPKTQPWILSDLKATQLKNRVFLVHPPLYPLKRHIGESLDSNKTQRDALQTLLNSNGITVVGAAHTHYAAATMHDKILHFDAGLSGAKINTGEDPYSSMFFITTLTNGDTKVVWKHSTSHAWTSPVVKDYILTGSGVVTPPIPPIPLPKIITDTFGDNTSIIVLAVLIVLLIYVINKYS